MTKALDRAEQKAIDDAAAKTTILPAGAAKGVNKKTAPMTAHHLKATKPKRTLKAPAKKAQAKTTTKRQAKATPAAAQRASGTITTVDIATEQGISAKTLRARIRRNIDAWAPLFVDGEKHVFKNNKATRTKITALLS